MSLPVVEYLKLPEGGEPYLEGHKCSECGSIFLGERKVCSNCFARDSMKSIKLKNTGKLYSYSIVFRSFPGIEVDKHKSALAYLNKKYLAPPLIRPVAIKNNLITNF